MFATSILTQFVALTSLIASASAVPFDWPSYDSHTSSFSTSTFSSPTWTYSASMRTSTRSYLPTGTAISTARPSSGLVKAQDNDGDVSSFFGNNGLFPTGSSLLADNDFFGKEKRSLDLGDIDRLTALPTTTRGRSFDKDQTDRSSTVFSTKSRFGTDGLPTTSPTNSRFGKDVIPTGSFTTSRSSIDGFSLSSFATPHFSTEGSSSVFPTSSPVFNGY